MLTRLSRSQTKSNVFIALTDQLKSSDLFVHISKWPYGNIRGHIISSNTASMIAGFTALTQVILPRGSGAACHQREQFIFSFHQRDFFDAI